MEDVENQRLMDLMRENPTLRYKDFIKKYGDRLSYFDDISGWTTNDRGILSTEVTNIKTGSGSLKITAEADELIILDKVISEDLSATDRFNFRFYIEDVSKVGYIIIYLSHESSVTNNYNIRVDDSDMSNGWNSLSLLKTDFNDEGGDWTQQAIALRVRVDILETDRYVILDSIFLQQEALPKVLIQFDDAYESVYTKAMPKMYEYGMIGTCYVVPDFVGANSIMSEEQLLDMYANNFWDLGNHTYTHRTLTDLSYSEIVEELSSCKEWLEERGYTRASRHLAYPRGEYNDTVLQAVKDTNMISARKTTGTLGDYPQSYPIYNQFTLEPILTLTNTTTNQDCDDAISRAITSNATLIIYGHGIEDTPSDTYSVATSVFEYLLSALDSADIQTLSITEWVKTSRSDVFNDEG
jgi:peptidoglycan/xylan/chitin deacetylase (PgdA/CDA1 family)